MSHAVSSVDGPAAEVRPAAGSGWAWAWPWLVMAVSLLVCYAYFVATEQTWDEFYVYLRCGQNLIHGQGMGFGPDEPAYVVTSLLQVGLAAVAASINGSDVFVPCIRLLSISNVLALAGALWLLTWHLGGRASGRLLSVLLTLMLLLDVKVTGFATNGMHGGLTALTLTLLLVAMSRPLPLQWLWTGLAAAGVVYGRFDGLAYVAAILLGAVLIARSDRPAIVKSTLLALATMLVCYLPWVLYAWRTFGSVVPLSLSALVGAETTTPLTPVGFALTLPIHWFEQMLATFKPIQAELGGWPGWINVTGFAFAAGSVVSTFLRSTPAIFRLAGVGFIGGTLGLAVIAILCEQVAPTLYTPAAWCGYIAFAGALAHPIGWFARTSRAALLNTLLTAVILIFMTAICTMSWVQQGVFQKELDNAMRGNIGEWLEMHVKEGETVFLAVPIGQLAYHSPGVILDWPGVLSPRVVEARAQTKLNRISAITTLKPQWLVLRHADMLKAELIPELVNDYSLGYALTAQPQLNTYDRLPGRPWLTANQSLYILKRTPGQGPGAATPPPPTSAPTTSPNDADTTAAPEG